MTVTVARSTPFYPLSERPVARRLVLDNGCLTGYSEDFVQPKQIVQESGTYYLMFTGIGPTGTATCIASAATAVGPFTSAQVLVTGVRYGWLINDGSAWWLFAASGINIGAWKNTGTLASGAWVSQGTVLSPPGGSAWDSHEVNEVCVVPDSRPGHTGYLMFYMGQFLATGATGGLTDGRPATEQVGLATASSLSGTWTKVTSIATPPSGQTAGSGLIVACSGNSSDFAGTEISDPSVLYTNGLFWLLTSCCWWGSAAGTSALGIWTASDPINGPWTRRGQALERGIWPSPDSCAVNTGSIIIPGDGNAYYTYQASPINQANTVTTAKSNAYQATLDPASFWYGPHTALWQRVEAESGDARITTPVGSWTAEAALSSSGDADYYSATSGAQIQFAFSGSRVRVGAQAGSPNAILQVALDGVNQGSPVDMYVADGGSPNQTPVLVYDSGELSPGSHTVTVTRTGANPSSTAGRLVADYFDYIPA